MKTVCNVSHRISLHLWRLWPAALCQEVYHMLYIKYLYQRRTVKVGRINLVNTLDLYTAEEADFFV